MLSFTMAKVTYDETSEAFQLQRLGLNVQDPAWHGKATKRALELRARLARKDPSRFCDFVLKDERTGAPITQAPIHERWHEILNSENRVCIFSHVEAGKTNQIAIGRALYELGRDPNLKIAIISNTNDLAKKITRQIGQYIKKSPELHAVFPGLQPTDDPSLQWRAQALTVKRPGMGAKDPSIQAAGMHGNIIGSRIDLMIFDDVLDFENTQTPSPREDAYRWLKYIMGRLTAEGRVWAIGNAWHPDDAMHRLEKDGFKTYRFPVMLTDGSLTWPERWSRQRIEAARGPGGMGPLEFARQLMCQARDDTSMRFKSEWIERCRERGQPFRLLDDVTQLFDEHEMTDEQRQEYAAAAEACWRLGGGFLNGGGIVTGVDLAVSKSSTADKTVLFTIYVDGATGDRRVLSIRSGKWSGPEIINEIVKCYNDFGGLFIVESNQSQMYISQMLQSSTAIPIIPFNTSSRNKFDPAHGIEAVATEMANGKWIIPGLDTRGEVSHEVADWISELLYFDPREHTGDRVMASWFAREGARRFDPQARHSPIGLRTF